MKEHQKLSKLSLIYCTFFGSGLLPKMPGTYGSLAAMLVAYLISLFSIINYFFIFSVILFFISIPIVQKAMKQSKTSDPGWIVIDEVAGQWLSFAFTPIAILLDHPWLFLVGFILFRFFDIIKPLGIQSLEKLPGAWGVMSDDMLGGFYAGILLALLAIHAL